MPYSEGYPDKTLEEKLTTVVIHHEGDDATFDVKTIQRIDMENGMYDIAYHYAISPEGKTYEERDVSVRGVHVLNGNSEKVGVLLLGDFNPGYEKYPEKPDPSDNKPTLGQYTAAADLMQYLDHMYGIDMVGGHNEFNDTVCPGENAKPLVD